MSFSAVTPATNEMCSIATAEAGEKCLLTKDAIAALKRLEPNGPLWYVKEDGSRDATHWIVL